MTAFDRAPFYEPAGTVSAESERVIAGGSDAGVGVTRERVTEALRTVLDPELGLSVVELGLIYGIEVRNATVAVTMTLTAPGCPIHDVMPGWIRDAVMRIPGVEHVDVHLTFDPPWTPGRMEKRAC
jgi:metal-sulfur cluster biosynthetic enzyme